MTQAGRSRQVSGTRQLRIHRKSATRVSSAFRCGRARQQPGGIRSCRARLPCSRSRRAHWRFEQPVSFMQIDLPFSLPGVVCEALFDRELVHCDLRMPADVRDAHFSGVLRSIQNRIDLVEPTNLLLDSWALMMSEAMLRRLSSHGERHARASFGKIPGRGVASVIDYIEAAIDQDLRLSSLASVAAMSVYHFARSFEETVGTCFTPTCCRGASHAPARC